MMSLTAAEETGDHEHKSWQKETPSEFTFKYKVNRKISLWSVCPI